MLDPVIEKINDPAEPMSLLGRIKDRPYSFFLDSSCVDEKLGRFSFLGCDPFLVFRSKKNNIMLEHRGGARQAFKANPFTSLKDIFRKYSILNTNRDIPLTSGGVGYFSYDLKDFIEDLPDMAEDDIRLDDCVMGFYDVVVIYDNLKRISYIASSGLPDGGGRNAVRRLNEFKEMIYNGGGGEKQFFHPRPAALTSNFSKESYIEAILKAKHYIKKGDIYQVNLSQRFRTKLNTDIFDLYRSLRAFSPAPFSSYMDLGDAAILSSSPERFLLKKGNYIETRPIKGTRPRGDNDTADAVLEKELLESHKDRAEHIMIVDLERNDLGKICEYGTVKPAESFVLERYSNVFHLVSTVSGKLKPGICPMDCLMAAFPGGSITGAPKIRSMEIIEELEPVKRSVYTGAIGYISFDGNMDTSIAIRTFVVKGRDIYFQVGGGIVADSVPENEYEETLHKAGGLMRALGIEQGNRECVKV